MNLLDELRCMDAGVYSPQEIDDLCERAAAHIAELERERNEAERQATMYSRLFISVAPVGSQQYLAACAELAAQQNTASSVQRAEGDAE